MSTDKERLDVLLVLHGLETTRERAKRQILSGKVFVDNIRVDKPGTLVKTSSNINIINSACVYVGRGGLKLEKALDFFQCDVTQKIFIDVGASTGGFTDCLLRNGAAKVYALDVGYGQLAWKLRCDSRVVSMERTNIRNVTPESFPDKIGGAVVDVSFISLKLVLPKIKSLLTEGSEIIALVKPQFEAGKGKVSKIGVVSNPEIHIDVLNEIILFCQDIGLSLLGLTYSPIKGPSGNIEFLVHLTNDVKKSARVEGNAISEIVLQAHTNLGVVKG